MKELTDKRDRGSKACSLPLSLDGLIWNMVISSGYLLGSCGTGVGSLLLWAKRNIFPLDEE